MTANNKAVKGRGELPLLTSVHRESEKGNSRKLRERHKDKEQDAYTFYSTEALIYEDRSCQALAGPFRPRQAIISRLRRTQNAMKQTIAGKA